ncbi:hypothetical protein HAHI6034_10930 [Hathewaya histolytica]|uniref:Uncharacterized protein n=1 Tax=Hathewaya histolytica TaxID=1498 RepID=A0A4U9RBY9_HATHI|nr:hypothetical protein [Hathewaya histolytica]VTQ88686.1 Uncharacterised protein [Hathewaya histolytica]
MHKNEIKDLIFFMLIVAFSFFYRYVPLELQGFIGFLSGVIAMWTRIKEK